MTEYVSLAPSYRPIHQMFSAQVAELIWAWPNIQDGLGQTFKLGTPRDAVNKK